jgi:hypothetical protein
MLPTVLPELSPIAKGISSGLTERGKIKIGEKGAKKTSSGGNEFQQPKKLDHFRVTTLERGEDGNFLTDEKIHAILGGPNPYEIPIVLMFDDISRNFRTMYVCYRGKTRWCLGDGENAHRVNDKAELFRVECPCERLKQDYKGDSRCKIAGILSVVIRGAENVGGVWVLRTTSWNICRGVLSSLALIQSITQGKLAGIPFWLTISPKATTTPDGKQQTIYVVGIEYRGTPDSLMDRGYQNLLQSAKYAKRYELVAAEVESIVTANIPATEDAEFTEEFIPEQAVIEPPPPTARRGRAPKPEPIPPTVTLGDPAGTSGTTEPSEPEAGEPEAGEPEAGEPEAGESPDGNDLF